MNERPNPSDTDEERRPPPEDAPVETPEADPRTEGAPDGGEPRSVDDETDGGEPESADDAEPGTSGEPGSGGSPAGP